jgi:predicted enzyme related to lactoylglutathione lyase
MFQGIKLVVFPVKDIARARTIYSTLTGVEPYVDAPYYVGFRAANQEIGLDPHGFSKGMTGPISYFEVQDIKQSVQALVDSGATIDQDVHDVGGGKLIASVKDADNNTIWLAQA